MTVTAVFQMCISWLDQESRMRKNIYPTKWNLQKNHSPDNNLSFLLKQESMLFSWPYGMDSRLRGNDKNFASLIYLGIVTVKYKEDTFFYPELQFGGLDKYICHNVRIFVCIY